VLSADEGPGSDVGLVLYLHGEGVSLACRRGPCAVQSCTLVALQLDAALPSPSCAAEAARRYSHKRRYDPALLHVTVFES
jgi:hypothetical protein